MINIINIFLFRLHCMFALCVCVHPNTFPMHLTLCRLPLLVWVSLSPGPPPPVQETVDANLQKLTQLVNKESNLIEKVLLLSF